MGFSLKQSGFGGGIVSPQLLGRTDQVKYSVGLQQCQNAWITRYGTFENRPGTQFIGEVKDSSNPLRLIPFIFSQSVSYLLEVGNDYFRPWLNGAAVVVTPAVWDNTITYDQGDFVLYQSRVRRSLQANNLNHTPPNAGLSDSWWQQMPNGPIVGSTGLVEVATNIPQASLSALQYVQQNDIMTLAQQGIVPQQFLRFSSSKWQQRAFTQSTGINPPGSVVATAGSTPGSPPAAPTGVTATGGTAVPHHDRYVITAFSYAAGTEGAASSVAIATVGQADNVNHVSLAWTAVAGADGYAIYKEFNPASPTALGIIGVVDTNAFVDTGIICSYPAHRAPSGTPGQTTFQYVVTAVSLATSAESLVSSTATCVGGTQTADKPNIISWSAVSGAKAYRIYRIVSGIPGFIGQVDDPTVVFNDIGYVPDQATQPPTTSSLFTTANDYPAIVGYFQQRLCFGNTINEPQTVNCSRVGSDYNFTTSTPVADDDSIEFTIAGKQVQPIRALIDIGKLIIHTDNAEYVASGNVSGAITPSAIGVVNQGSAGSHTVPPVSIGNADLFVQAGGNRVLDLRYEVQAFGYTGKDLTKFAPDLFKGRTIVDAAWQKLPHSIVWYVFDNGTVAGLTYTRDGAQDDVVAWHYHAFTNGAVENVAVVPEGTQFATYFLVRRTINGSTKRYIERLAPRDCLDTVNFTDSYFCDCSLTFDGRVTDGTTIHLTTGGGWTPTDIVTATSSVAKFTSGDVGNAVVLQQKDPLTGLVTDQVTIDITGYTSTTVVTGKPRRTVPTWAQAALATWGKAVKSFSGIGHLEGQAISVFGDGNVIADPLDSGYATITVSGGAFTIPKPAMVVTAGLPIDMRGQTLPLENAQGETVMNKRIAIRECCPMFYNSRGGSFGQDFAHLNQWKDPVSPTMGFPTPPFTGPIRIPVQGSPQTTGQVCWRLTNPVPFSMSAIVLSGETGS